MRFLLVLLSAVAVAQDVDTLEKSARTAYSKGDYAAARQSLDQAWDLLQQTPAADPKRYEILKLQANVTSAAGDYASARQFIEQAMVWREQANGENDPKLPEEWIELATICDREKNFDRAIALLEQARHRHVELYGVVSGQVADDFSRIALVYMDDRQPGQATPPLEAAIEIRGKAIGDEHPGLLPELDRLASIWLTLREYEKAELVFRRALVIRERLLGPDNAGLIETVEGLAYAQFGEKKLDDAEAGYKRLLALWLVATKDPSHPMIALTLDKIAVFYRETKRWDDGTKAAEKALALRAMFLANGYAAESTARLGHGDTKIALAYLRSALGVLDESRPEHEEARKILEKSIAELSTDSKPAPKAPTKATARKQ